MSGSRGFPCFFLFFFCFYEANFQVIVLGKLYARDEEEKRKETLRKRVCLQI